MTHSIVIADDQVMIAKALTGIIENFGKYEVLYDVQNGKALMEKFKQPKNIPDLVLLDIYMPEMDGLETAQWLHQAHPQVRILTLTVESNPQSIIKMFRNGANGYLDKSSHPRDLEEALGEVIGSGFYLPSRKVYKDVFDVIVKGEAEQFNAQEIEFFRYAATELTYEEVGKKMCRGTRTVESMRDELFKKIGVKTRVGLVVYGIKNGIIKL